MFCKKLTLLFFVFLFSQISVNAQDSFRIGLLPNELGFKDVEFLYPPGTDFEFNKKKGEIKPRFQYHSVEISGLSDNYYESSEKIKKSSYYKKCEENQCINIPENESWQVSVTGDRVNFSINYNQFLKRADTNNKKEYEEYKLALSQFRTETKEFLTKIEEARKTCLDKKDEKEVVTCDSSVEKDIVFNYCEETKTQIDQKACNLEREKFAETQVLVNRFNRLYFDLLAEISKQYKAANLNWNFSLIQNIVQKILESIPVPQKSSLARFGLVVNDYKSFVLLNPSVWLEVDDADKFFPEPGKIVPWQQRLNGRFLIRFYRDENGQFIQDPFYKLTTRKTSTHLDKTLKNTLQASSTDIQAAKTLYSKKFIAIFQEGFKKNNSFPRDTVCNNAENDPQKCNSQLLFFDDYDKPIKDCLELFEPTAKCPNVIDTSTFGVRSQIMPIIIVYLNKQPIPINLNSNLFQLSQTYPLPSLEKVKLLRLHNGIYKRVKNLNGYLLLLPGDSIKFKL